jgi:hypothetical protein
MRMSSFLSCSFVSHKETSIEDLPMKKRALGAFGAR